MNGIIFHIQREIGISSRVSAASWGIKFGAGDPLAMWCTLYIHALLTRI